jgi:hypothetical protein
VVRDFNFTSGPKSIIFEAALWSLRLTSKKQQLPNLKPSLEPEPRVAKLLVGPFFRTDVGLVHVVRRHLRGKGSLENTQSMLQPHIDAIVLIVGHVVPR